jgi:hypothetical protein
MTTIDENKPVLPVPCVRYPGYSAAQFVHPEGVCACFHGGPAPIAAPSPRPSFDSFVPMQRNSS